MSLVQSTIYRGARGFRAYVELVTARFFGMRVERAGFFPFISQIIFLFSFLLQTGFRQDISLSIQLPLKQKHREQHSPHPVVIFSSPLV